MNSGNDYVLQVKRNHPKLYADLAARHAAEPPPAPGYYTQHERRSGHDYSWQTRVLDCQGTPWPAVWPGLAQCVVVVKTDVYHGITTQHTHFYLTSLRTDDLAALAAGIRGHWGIENNLHRTRDVHFQQDTNGIRHPTAAFNLALFNTLVLNYLLLHVHQSVSYAQICFAQNFKQWWRT